MSSTVNSTRAATPHPSGASSGVLSGSGVVVQFVLLALAWGSSFLFIKIGLEELSPTQVVLARMVFGAAALGVFATATRSPIPRDLRLWGHLTVVTTLLCVVPFTLFAWAEQEISSGLASIFNATTPLIAMVAAAVMLTSERLTRERVVGLGLGFVGVVIIIGPFGGLGGGSVSAQLACLGATTCYGVAFAYLRRYVAGRGVPAASLAFIQILIGALMMILAAPWVASSPVDGLSWRVVVSMVVLGVFGTGFAYVWNTNIVTSWGATNGAAVTYLSPIVGVALGVIVLSEPLTWNQPLGATLVVVGIMTSHGRVHRVVRLRSSIDE
ncbi:DMT family transporter [Demetria terragena]|uniref:DMT family transporter n=1 Tax=Demetria terragena TaxID=63959 RepID=UPI000A00BAD9|nr:DMT family transporter [Demetria terragena]